MVFSVKIQRKKRLFIANVGFRVSRTRSEDVAKRCLFPQIKNVLSYVTFQCLLFYFLTHRNYKCEDKLNFGCRVEC